MKLDTGIHIVKHLVFFKKIGVTECELEKLMENEEMYWHQPRGIEMDPGGGQYRIFPSDC
jgi:hypothetical protein